MIPCIKGYPMRPCAGVKLTPENVIAVTQEAWKAGYILQRKLNGDRGILEVGRNGVITLWNRYGDEYILPCNLQPFKKVLSGTVFDGEIYNGEFHPFEQLGNGDTAETRINNCKFSCAMYGIPYVFGGITADWLIGEVTLITNPRTRMWEGVVAKAAKSKYMPLTTATQDSPLWTKLKWC